MLPSKPTSPKDRSDKRRPDVRSEAFFRLLAELVYQPNATLPQVSHQLDLSVSTIKRMLSILRRAGIVHGRLNSPHLRLDLSPLGNPPFIFVKALILAEPNIEILRNELQKDGATQPCDAERRLLNRLCNEVPRLDQYKGKVIIESGHVVLGARDFGLLMVVHAVSNPVLYNFAMAAVEVDKGITRTQTVMITHTRESPK